MVLQLKNGWLDIAYFRNKFGVDVWKEFQPVYERLRANEMLEREDDKIVFTRRGLLEVENFLVEFFEPELRTVRYA
jgi:oxygen-independent coproporphyrinogen-3 oxidase